MLQRSSGMLPFDSDVFQSAAAVLALEKYAAVTHFTVRLYDQNERMIAPPTGSNRFVALFSAAREPPIASKCAARCFAEEAHPPCVCVENEEGLAVIGAPLVHEDRVVCAAIAGYALTTHVGHIQLERLSRATGLPFESLWRLVRNELPIPVSRLQLYGDLLKIIGDTLISEHNRGRKLERTLSELELASRSKDEFLATLSHELRVPLNAIHGWAQMLEAGTLDPVTTAIAVEAIARSTETQIRLVNDLLDISRIIAGKLQLDIQAVDLASEIDAVLAEIRPTADGKGIRLEADLDRSVPITTGDPDRLRQVFFNLISNAIKFTPSGGNVRIRLERDGSDARIVVTDTGQGIRPDFLPHIFERFRQADSSTTRQHGGLGLGLSIVKHLVELHNGTVCAESKGYSQGATFTVTLPLRRVEEPTVQGSVKPTTEEPPSLNGVRVWIIDDNREGRVMLRKLLEMSGAEVTDLKSANEALNMLDQSTPQVLVSDLGMPGMDGYALMRQVRARGAERGGNVPAIAQSGYASAEDRERALSSGYQLHFPKPCDPDELIRAIATLVKKA